MQKELDNWINGQNNKKCAHSDALMLRFTTFLIERAKFYLKFKEMLTLGRNGK